MSNALPLNEKGRECQVRRQVGAMWGPVTLECRCKNADPAFDVNQDLLRIYVDRSATENWKIQFRCLGSTNFRRSSPRKVDSSIYIEDGNLFVIF
jgi:hypothetical protein